MYLTLNHQKLSLALLAVSVVLCTQIVSSAELSGCQLFPKDNIWNTAIDTLPVDPQSDIYINTIGRNTAFHPDFGSGFYQGGPIGIPFDIVNAQQAGLSVSFNYADESDIGPYPIPPNPSIEGGVNGSGDRHILILQEDSCTLYELFDATLQSDGWHAGSGAIFDLNSNALRPDSWTSADAAGLPILPGLIRYDEIIAGKIEHPIRFTVPQTQKAHIWPARHDASSLTDTIYPPMGQYFRLKSSFNINRFSPANQVILKAMKKHGLILADNGSAWFISGVPDARWNNDDLRDLKQLTGNDFEAVQVSSLIVNPDSAQVNLAGSAKSSKFVFPWFLLLE